MMNEPGHGGEADCEIRVDDEGELKFWAHELCVDQSTLLRAVKEAGPSLGDIREYLRTHRSVVRRGDLRSRS
jgi:hypothetical protein